MKARFGIRGKIALLVIVATAACAYLVALLLSHRAQELLRSHEIVDLGDEAQLRGWEMIDSVNGLREDARAVLYSDAFRAAALEEDPIALEEAAEEACSRFWRRYLRAEVVTAAADGTELANLVFEEKATMDGVSGWQPPMDKLVGASATGIAVSPIQRLSAIMLPVDAGETPVTAPGAKNVAGVWAYAPLRSDDGMGAAPMEGSEPGSRRYLRIFMWLTELNSPRHLLALLDADGGFLIRPNESDATDSGNDAVFQAFARSPNLQARFHRENEESLDTEQPQVDRLDQKERAPLLAVPYFQEGTPQPRIVGAWNAWVSTGKLGDPRRARGGGTGTLEDYALALQSDLGPLGRIGGVAENSGEVRLLAWSEDQLTELRERLVASLEQTFGDAFDGIDWRSPTVCDTTTIWAVRLEIDSMGERVPYLLLYGVLDAELAYAIERELAVLRQIALLIAAGAGIVSFAFSIVFIRPLQRMTAMAKKVVGSEPGRLHESLQEMVGTLPVDRRDEVGDIARSSKVLFGEVIEAHRELDRRVQARTEKLNAAKIELTEANERLQSLNRDKDLFVAKISHNLRQPLNAIYLEVETFLELYEPNAEQAEALKNIQGHADRQQDMVSEILAYQKIIMGSEKLNKQEIDARAFVNGLAESHRGTAERNGNELVTEIGDGIGTLQADHLALTKILDNLLTNACKFTTDGRVTIGANHRSIDGEGWIEFSISDTGAGMSPDEQAKAFTPFVYRKVGNATGNGLGLVICKELTEQMGGRIGFISEVDKGTRFNILLPVIARGDHYAEEAGPAPVPAPVAPTVEEPEAEPDTPLPAGSGTILIIDDEERARELLADLLRNQGYAVLTADTGEEGLQLARERQPDVITLDVVMPDKDGWQVLSELKGDPETAAIPVVMVSVMADRTRGLALGVSDVLVKPIDTKQLNRVVQRAAGNVPQQNILVVDDDDASRSNLCKLIRHDGWQTIEASDGREALEVLERTLPAAIILDLVMPVMDGFDFLSAIEKHAKSRSIPILVVTGKDPSAEETTFLRKRVEDIITKGGGTAQSVIEHIHELLLKK